MFVEESVKVKDILKYNEGLVAIINSEKLFSDDKGERNVLSRKTSYAIGRQQDQFQPIIDRVAKEKTKAKEEADAVSNQALSAGKDRKECDQERMDYFKNQIELIESTEETVKVFEKPLKDFGDFIVPTYAFKCLDEKFIDLE